MTLPFTYSVVYRLNTLSYTYFGLTESCNTLSRHRLCLFITIEIKSRNWLTSAVFVVFLYFLVQICFVWTISGLCMSVCTQVVYSQQIESFFWLLDLFPFETRCGVCRLLIIYINNPTHLSLCRWSSLLWLAAAHSIGVRNQCSTPTLWVCGECLGKHPCAVWHVHRGWRISNAGVDIFHDQVIFPSSWVLGSFSLCQVHCFLLSALANNSIPIFCPLTH